MAKKQAKSGPPNIVQVAQVRVILNDSDDISTYYVNFVEVSAGMHDFALTLAKLPGRLSPEKASEVTASGVLRVEPTLQIVFPPTLVPGLINALTLQKAMFEKQHGPIADVSLPPKVLA